ncbi:MAG: segregation/condensation protein A [Candidatus Latescibacterota bacterium]|nr:segregation/condensation protein A [Candidatus Latescibacterota bacterium]
MTDTPPNETPDPDLTIIPDDAVSDEAARVEAAEAKALIDDYGVNLDVFEGPLDLLLYLIRKSEVDIYDIPVARITAQYLAFLREVHLLDLESAADFILMAATLMKIKSQMLLPRDIEGEELDEGFGDPREELVRKLLEYQQFKEIADWLSDQGIEQRDVYQRPGGLPDDTEDAELQPVSLFDLLKVYKHVVDHVPQAAVHQIVEEEVATEDCIDRILGELHQRSRLRFHELVVGQSRVTLVATFIGILELLKSQRIRVHQAQPFDDIWIESRAQPEQPETPDDEALNDETQNAETQDGGTPSTSADEQDASDSSQNTRHQEPNATFETQASSSPTTSSSTGLMPSSDDDERSDTQDEEPNPPSATALATQEPDDLESDAQRLVDAAERLGEAVGPAPPTQDQADALDQGQPRPPTQGRTDEWEDPQPSGPADLPPPPTPSPDGLAGPEERT